MPRGRKRRGEGPARAVVNKRSRTGGRGKIFYKGEQDDVEEGRGAGSARIHQSAVEWPDSLEHLHNAAIAAGSHKTAEPPDAGAVDVNEMDAGPVVSAYQQLLASVGAGATRHDYDSDNDSDDDSDDDGSDEDDKVVLAGAEGADDADISDGDDFLEQGERLGANDDPAAADGYDDDDDDYVQADADDDGDDDDGKVDHDDDADDDNDDDDEDKDEQVPNLQDELGSDGDDDNDGDAQGDGIVDPYRRCFAPDLSVADQSDAPASPYRAVEAIPIASIACDSVLPMSGTQVWTDSDSVPMAQVPADLSGLSIRPRLLSHFHTLPAASDWTDATRRLFSWLNAYADVLYGVLSHAALSTLRSAVLLHAVNHVMKTRDTVLRNNTRLAKARAAGNRDLELADIGFTRAKVLILTPFRATAHALVQQLLEIVPHADSVSHLRRFHDEFGPPTDQADPANKPQDYQDMFAGNIDDCFRIGIALQRRAVKLYCDFFTSDIIIASPLGLRLATGTDGEHGGDYDFLSSIEVLVVEQAQVLAMQNWDHVVNVFDRSNRIPRDGHGVDYSRIKPWYLAGAMRQVRQTVVLSRFLSAELMALFRRKTGGLRGRVRVRGIYPGSVPQCLHAGIRHVFLRVPRASTSSTSLTALPETRFQHFVQHVLTRFESDLLSHVLVVVPDYLDYVRVRKHIRTHQLDALCCSEYTPTPDISRARSRFFHAQRCRILVITERFQFFRRLRLRGVQHVVWYAPPRFPHLYPEFANMIVEHSATAAGTVTSIVHAADALALERVLGSKRARSVLTATPGNDTTTFTTV